jgi:hypothetical protein
MARTNTTTTQTPKGHHSNQHDYLHVPHPIHHQNPVRRLQADSEKSQCFIKPTCRAAIDRTNQTGSMRSQSSKLTNQTIWGKEHCQEIDQTGPLAFVPTFSAAEQNNTGAQLDST